MNVREFSQAIVDQLNGQEWPLPFEAVRSYTPKLEVPDLDALRVIVVPGSYALEELEDETGWRREIGVQIGVLKRLSHRVAETGQEDNAELDPLVDFVEDLADYFEDDPYVAPQRFQLDSLQVDPVYDYESLVQQRKFLSVLHLTFMQIVG
jgi:hypothetical protein